MMELPPIPYSTTGQFMLGLLGFLMIVGTVLWIWNQGSKAFGRTPPLNDELEKRDKALRKMIFASENNLKERIKKLEDLYAEMQADRIRKWAELQREIAEQNAALSYIRGKLDEQEGK